MITRTVKVNLVALFFRKPDSAGHQRNITPEALQYNQTLIQIFDGINIG